MRVLVMPSWYPVAGDGFGQFCEDQAAASQRLTDLDVLVAYVQPIPAGEASSLAHVSSVEYIERHHVQICFVRAASKPGRGIVYLINYFRAVRRIHRSLCDRGIDFDLIHAHAVLPGGLGAALLSRWLKIPYVLTEHSVELRTVIKSGLKRFLVHRIYQKAKVVMAVGERLARELKEDWGLSDIVLTPNGVDTDFFTPAKASEFREGTHAPKLKLTFIGNLLEQKGLFDLIDAMSLLQTSHSNTSYELSIVGSGRDRSKLETYVLERELESKVRFRGRLAHELLPDVLRASDCLILPSHKESFGIVIVEALACGIPVIATRCGGPEEIISETNGILVPVRSPKALAEAIRALGETRIKYDRQKIHDSIRDRFSLRKTVETVRTTYQRATRMRN